MGIFKRVAQGAVNIAWRATYGALPSNKPVQKRSYASAQTSALTSSWTVQPKPIDADIKSGLRILRARSRHEAQNGDYVKRFLNLVKANVVGHQGFVMRARVLDQQNKPDKHASAALMDSFSQWGKKDNCTVTGKVSWRMAQRLFIETVARDGEVLVRKVLGWKKNKWRFALQFLDVELLDVNYNVTLASGNVVKMGVELDNWRRPVAYHLLTTGTGDDVYTYGSQKYQRIPAAEIIHEFLPEWVLQTRGVPWVATGLLRLNMLSGYEEAELVASRAGASKFAAYERNDDEVPLQDASVMAGSTDTDEKGRFVQDMDAGMVEVVPDGYTLKLLDPQHPNAAYKDFVKACLRGISAGLGVSYHALANDLEGANYNSLREGKLQDQDAWLPLQDWMAEVFCEPVYNEWLKISLLAQAITLMGKPLK
ncbi:MAG: phage portal protein, partial [Rhodospirillaceae bacterium]|nr:phage portal protein [Rhodospirillaceae bacterium]